MPRLEDRCAEFTGVGSRCVLRVRDPPRSIRASITRQIYGGTPEVRIAPQRGASVIEVLIDTFAGVWHFAFGHRQARSLVRQKSSAFKGRGGRTLAPCRGLDCHAMEQIPDAACGWASADLYEFFEHAFTGYFYPKIRSGR